MQNRPDLTKILTVGRYYSMNFASIYMRVLSVFPSKVKLAIYYKDCDLLAERPKWYKRKDMNLDILSLWRLYK